MGSRALKLGAALLLLSASALAAEPTAADRENARAYMTEGRSKRDSGDLKSALRAFEAADALMHVPTTSLEVARTQAMAGHLIEARDLALQAARSPAKPGEPPPFQEARAAAQKLADDLEARIPSIRIVLKGVAADAAEVHIDDTLLPTVAVGLPRKLNPGSHMIAVKAGGVERRMSIQVLEREAKDVPVDLSARADASSATSTASVGAPPPPQATSPADSGGRSAGPWMALGLTSLGLGVVGIAIGSITGVMSISTTNTVKGQCTGNLCPPVLSDGRDTNAVLTDARNLGGMSTVAFIAGGVFAAAGVVFVVVGASHQSRGETARLELGASLTSVHLSGTF